MMAQEKQVFVKYVQIKQKVVCGRIFVYGKHCHSCACVCRCVAINFKTLYIAKKWFTNNALLGKKTSVKMTAKLFHAYDVAMKRFFLQLQVILHK